MTTAPESTLNNMTGPEGGDHGASLSPSSNPIVDIQQRVAPYVLGFLWLHVPGIALIGALLGDWQGPTMGAGILAAAATVSWRLSGIVAQTRYLIAVASMGMVALIVYQFMGHPWQVDIHMYFFATLAMLTVFCDWRAILVAASTVAVHHLLLNFVMPSAVFPDGAEFFRVVLHAVIVVAETATLVWLCAKLSSAFGEAQQSVDRARAAETTAQALSERQSQMERRAAEERQQTLTELADVFESKVGQMVGSLSARALEMSDQAETLKGVATEARERSDSTAQRAGDVTDNTQTVASATEEMSTSISGIAEQVSHSARITGEAVRRIEQTDGTVQGLAEAAERIGEVTSLISDIAEQTNLLALNATIEAARAGDAGKGFAVVAGEVKGLANQTAKATEEITGQISGMQAVTKETVDAIAQIRETIAEIDKVSGTIATSVEEQDASVTEISGNTSQIADGTALVTSEITEVRRAVDRAGEASQQSLSAAKELVGQVEQLQTEVAEFARHVRAA